MKLEQIEDAEFIYIIKELIENKEVLKMKYYIQHFDISCFEHCLHVAYYNYKICKKLRLDYKSAAIGGMLHDFFLYDWRVKSPDRKRFHAFHHGYTSYKNAIKVCDLNKIEKDIIIKHMFPVRVIPPRYAETWITTLVDKYCTLAETVEYIKNNKFKKQII